MPTYQYSCTECGHFFEQFQSFSEDSLTVCPECDGRLRKVFNAVGVVFKGSGFYRTDSRAASATGDVPKPAAASASGDSGSSSTSTPAGNQDSTPSSTPAPSKPSPPSTKAGSAA